MLQKIFQKTNLQNSKKSDLYIVIFFIAYPFLYYSYRFFPAGEIVTIFGIKASSGNFSSFDVFIWVFFSKLLSLITFIILLVKLKGIWSYSLIVPFAMYFFQIIEVLNKKSKAMDEISFFIILPLIIISVYGIFKYKEYLKFNEEKKIFKFNQELTLLKSQALNAQMNPHFISNLTMSLQASINDKNITTTKESLIKFNRLSNLILRTTKSNLISLEEEINISRLYLDLQLFRFSNFSFDIKIEGIDEEDLEFIKVPPMIIQPLIENSFKHGIIDKKEKGEILINILVKENLIECTILDNGNGIKENPNLEKNQQTGISLPNITERLNIFGKIMDIELKKLLYLENIKDHNGSIIGCQTNVNIPIISI